MLTPHMATERLLGFMLGMVTPTEEEDAHIAGWKCPECTSVLHEAIDEHLRTFRLGAPKSRAARSTGC
jgi:hypothetical protein